MNMSRDANYITVANFIAIARHLTSIEPESDKGWKIVCFGSWDCGHFYSILIHKDSPLVAEAQDIANKLREYPIYDENLLSECEELVKEHIKQYATDDKELQLLIDEANAVDYCKSLLAPFKVA